jgi:hypothetical protein
MPEFMQVEVRAQFDLLALSYQTGNRFRITNMNFIHNNKDTTVDGPYQCGLSNDGNWVINDPLYNLANGATTVTNNQAPGANDVNGDCWHNKTVFQRLIAQYRSVLMDRVTYAVHMRQPANTSTESLKDVFFGLMFCYDDFPTPAANANYKHFWMIQHDQNFTRKALIPACPDGSSTGCTMAGSIDLKQLVANGDGPYEKELDYRATNSNTQRYQDSDGIPNFTSPVKKIWMIPSFMPEPWLDSETYAEGLQGVAEIQVRMNLYDLLPNYYNKC